MTLVNSDHKNTCSCLSLIFDFTFVTVQTNLLLSELTNFSPMRKLE